MQKCSRFIKVTVILSIYILLKLCVCVGVWHIAVETYFLENLTQKRDFYNFGRDLSYVQKSTP